tara:strand:- start:1176 stop:1559 length:384 start_codon:yes stop_codon:yes gene_type:complete
MNRDDLLKLHDHLCQEARELMERKNHDYSGGENQEFPFLNFSRVESMGITSTEKGFLVRMTDKMSRLSTFCEEGSFRVNDESLRDTILDIVNYSVLLYAYVQSKPPKALRSLASVSPAKVSYGSKQK